MLATIKIHSSYHKLFNETEYKADFVNYFDIVSYLKALHPKFNYYMNMIDNGVAEESYALLDSNYNIVSEEDLFIRKVKENDTVYLAPMIVGGGGKRGGLFAIAALVGIGIATGGFGLAAAGGGGAAAGVGSATSLVGGTGASAASVVAPATGSSGGGLLAGFNGMGGFARSLLGNIAMSFISSLFNKKPKIQQETDQNTREAGMFGSLTNTTQSGTPIALHYGLVRVAGHFLSGYIESEEHGKNDVIEVGDKF